MAVVFEATVQQELVLLKTPNEIIQKAEFKDNMTLYYSLYASHFCTSFEETLNPKPQHTAWGNPLIHIVSLEIPALTQMLQHPHTSLCLMPMQLMLCVCVRLRHDPGCNQWSADVGEGSWNGICPSLSSYATSGSIRMLLKKSQPEICRLPALLSSSLPSYPVFQSNMLLLSLEDWLLPGLRTMSLMLNVSIA